MLRPYPSSADEVEESSISLCVLNSLLSHVAFRCRLFEMFKLEDMIKKLKIKAIEAAQKLQQKLAGSAEHPAVAASPSTRANAHDIFPVGEEACLAELRSRQQKERDKARSRSNDHLQNPKLHRDRTNEAPVLSLAVLNNLLRRENISA